MQGSLASNVNRLLVFIRWESNYNRSFYLYAIYICWAIY